MQGTELIGVEKAIEEAIDGELLCIVDFKEESSYVLHAAIKIAAASHAQLTVLYPYRLNQVRSVPEVGQWKKSIDSDAKNNFTRMTDTLLKEYNIECEFKSEVGFVNDRVSAHMEHHRVGMIIVGKQMVMTNRESMSTMFDRLDCPFLVIPQPKK